MAKKKIKNTIEMDKVTYYPDADAICSCGAKFKIGSTKEKINIEVCSQCHPFYTGTQKFIDTSGRLEKFKERVQKHAEYLKTKKIKNSKDSTAKKNIEKVTLSKEEIGKGAK